MRRRLRTLIFTIGLLVIVLGGTGTILGAVLRQEPKFYTELADRTDWTVAERASDLLTRVQDLKNDVRGKAEWSGNFTGTDLNAFCTENLSEGTSYAGLLPSGFHSPRMVIEGDRVKLGVRYGKGFWTTVLSIEIRAWLVKNDVNVIAVEVMSFKAGGLSIGCQTLLDSITEAAHDSNIEVSWYRHQGNPVGLFRFYADQLRPATQIHTFKIKEARIAVAGRTRLESAQNGGLGANLLGE
jgi:hypothetical protein